MHWMLRIAFAIFILFNSFNELKGQFHYSVSYPCINTDGRPGDQGDFKHVYAYLLVSGAPTSKYKMHYGASTDTIYREVNKLGFDTFMFEYATRMTPFVYKVPNPPLLFADSNNKKKVLFMESDHPITFRGYLDYPIDSWGTNDKFYKNMAKQMDIRRNDVYYNYKNNFGKEFSAGCGVLPCFQSESKFNLLKKGSYMSVNSYTPILFKNYPWYFYGSRQILQVICNSDSAILEIKSTVDLLNGQKKGKLDTQILNKGNMLYLGSDKGNMTGTEVRTLNCADVRVYSGAYDSPREMLWEKQYNKPDSPYTESDAMLTAVYYSEVKLSTEYGYRYIVPQSKVLGDTIAWWYLILAKEFGQTKYGLDAIKPGYSSVQVLALQDNTKVKINGRNRTLKNKGDFFGDSVQWVGYIESDKPVNAVWYCAPMCGHGSYMLPALDMDRISKDTQSLPCFWGYKSKIQMPWKGPIAYVLAPGPRQPEVWINGRIKKLSQRCRWMSEEWYFDTIVMQHNYNNRIYSKNGCMGVYSFEFYGVNSQRAFVFGNEGVTPQLRMRINGEWNMTPTQPMQLCQNTTTKLEAVTAWYTPKSVQWLLPGGKTDTGSIVNFGFLDTGLQSIIIISERLDSSCGIQTLRDTLSRQVYVYSIPKFALGTDTAVCAGTWLKLYSSRSELPRPVWRENDTLLCQSCDSVLVQAMNKRTISASLSKVGCKVLRDTIVVRSFDSVQIAIQTDSIYCYGQKIQAKLSITPEQWNGLAKVTWNMPGGTDSVLITKADSSKWIKVEVSDVCGTIYKDSVFVHIAAPLFLGIKSDTTMCFGSRYKPQYSTAGGYKDSVYKLSWNGVIAIPDFTVSTDTQLLVILTDGCSTPDSQNITIRALLPVSIDLSKSKGEWCYGKAIPITALAKGGDTIANKWWLIQNNANKDSAQGFSFAPKVLVFNNGLYTIKLQNRCGVVDSQIQNKLTKSLHIALSESDTLCAGVADTLRGNIGSKGKIIGKRGGYVDSVATVDGVFQLAFPSNGLSIELIASDGCSIPDTVIITPVKSTPLVLQNPDTLWVCMQSLLEFKIQSTGGIRNRIAYNSTFLGQVYNNSAPKFISSSSGYAILRITDGCTSIKDSVFIKSIGSNQAIKHMDTTGCAVLESRMVLPPTELGSTWIVSAGDGSANVEKASQGGKYDTVYTAYQNEGSYFKTIALRSGNTQCPVGSAGIKVFPQPTADFIFIPEKVDISSPDVILKNTSKGATQYTWRLPDGSMRNGSEFEWKFADSGIFKFTLIAKNNQGCTDTMIKSIHVYGKILVYLPNAFRPAGVNKSFVPVVVNGKLKDYKLYNRWGQKLYEGIEPYIPEEGNVEQMLICVVTAESYGGKELKVKGTVVVLR